MKQKLLSILIISLSLLLTVSLFSQSTVKVEVEHTRQSIKKLGKAYNWDYFDTTSRVSIDKIKFEDLQGLWKASNGVFKFGDMLNSMSLTQPFPIEIKDGKYRRNLESQFEEFTLNNNEIICKKEDDYGVINKLTDKELVITWKQGENYTRYYYEK